MSTALIDVVSLLDVWAMLSATLKRDLHSRSVHGAALVFVSEAGDGIVWPMAGRRIEQVCELVQRWTDEHPARIVSVIALTANVVGPNGPLIGPRWLGPAPDAPIPYALTSAGFDATEPG
jgi:hypothetical protein